MLNLAYSCVYEFLTAAMPQPHLSYPDHMPAISSNVVLIKDYFTYLSFTWLLCKREWILIHTTNLSSISPGLDLPLTVLSTTMHYEIGPTVEEGLDEVWLSLLQFFDPESGNFEFLIMLLHHVEGTHKYPIAMQPIHLCAIHGLDLVSRMLSAESRTIAQLFI